MIGSLTEGHHLPMVAPAAILRCIGRIDSDVFPASFFRFAGQFAEECRPRGIVDALGHTMIVNHAVDMQVFYTDHPKSVYNLPRLLMGEVISSKGDTFVDSSYHLAMLLSLRGTLSKLAMFALNFRQGFFFLAKEARVSNFFSGREHGKRFQPDINTNLSRNFWQAFRITLNRERSIPLAGTAPSNSERFDLAMYRAVQDHLDMPNARGIQLALLINLKTALRVGERVVAISTTETRKARGLISLVPSEESFEGQINTNGYILKDLRMDGVEGGAFLFQYWIGGLLPIARKRRALLLIGLLALFQQVVIQPTALKECFVEFGFLLLCWIDPIQQRFTHVHILNLNATDVNRWDMPHPSALKGWPIHPRLESTGLSGPLDGNQGA